jgi:pyridoxamine 5'-phosphate oxidase
MPEHQLKKSEVNPIPVFERWYNEELRLSTASIPSACCLSTTGLDGYPNARFVSLKAVVDDAFVVTGPYASKKGHEIGRSNNVALTFWWHVTERQVRIQGTAAKIEEELADVYFCERTRNAQLVALVSRQGDEVNDLEDLCRLFRQTEMDFTARTIPRPKDWVGYAIKPILIELMEFRSTRFNDRKLYELKNGA